MLWLTRPIATIEEAQQELATEVEDVRLDFGEDAVEAAYWDLVNNVASQCTPEVASELRRRELGA